MFITELPSVQTCYVQFYTNKTIQRKEKNTPENHDPFPIKIFSNKNKIQCLGVFGNNTTSENFVWIWKHCLLYYCKPRCSSVLIRQKSLGKTGVLKFGSNFQMNPFGQKLKIAQIIENIWITYEQHTVVHFTYIWLLNVIAGPWKD